MESCSDCMSGYLEVEKVYKAFSGQEILKGVDLSVRQGEFVSIVGASGCGKTTLLRIIAGLETADSGRIILDGADITALPPEKRHVGMVFQHYALFEHMTVAENVGYSLKLQRVPKAEVAERVEKMLEKVGLPGSGHRMPDTLSGGQRQRVALARSIINAPKLLLLDESLTALDAALRRRMQQELKALQHELGITFIYITHDDEEALFMSDIIAIMDGGIFQRIGTPDEVKVCFAR